MPTDTGVGREGRTHQLLWGGGPAPASLWEQSGLLKAGPGCLVVGPGVPHPEPLASGLSVCPQGKRPWDVGPAGREAADLVWAQQERHPLFSPKQRFTQKSPSAAFFSKGCRMYNSRAFSVHRRQKLRGSSPFYLHCAAIHQSFTLHRKGELKVIF